MCVVGVMKGQYYLVWDSYYTIEAAHKGRPHRRGRGMVKCGHLRTEVKGPCGRILELFKHALQILPMGDGYSV